MPLRAAVDETRTLGPLRVTMLASFLQNWLLPRLPRLRARYPGLDFQVHTSDAIVDLVRDDHHAAIRFGAGNWPGLISEKLVDDWLDEHPFSEARVPRPH